MQLLCTVTYYWLQLFVAVTGYLFNVEHGTEHDIDNAYGFACIKHS